MKVTTEVIINQWNSINYTDGGFLQIDTDHPLDWYIGYLSISQKTLLLVCDSDISKINSSKSIRVTRSRRESDNRWTLSFELLRNEQESVFATLCCDIIEFSRSAHTETEALKLVIKRYKQWSKLLETQRSVLMDEGRRKGLIGELLFLEQKLTVMESSVQAIQGWVGPDGADQDFIYADGWFEIKSVGASATCVKISSLQQLDCHDTGELIVKRIDKVAPEKSGAFSLNDIVYRINNTLDTDAQNIFRAKLNSYGYIDLQEYSEQKYFCSNTQHYTVNNEFPILSTTVVPSQVISACYELSLAALKEWEKE